MKEPSVLLRVQVPSERYRNAERILDRLGMNPGDAVNLFLAQIELRQGLPFEVSLRDGTLLSSGRQAVEWTEALGEY
jgi:DNA-damage-inducible protein J